MLRRRSVRLRIVVLVLVPVIALVALYGVILSLTVGSLLSFRQGTRVGAEVTTPVSMAQLQLSIERGLALQYIADPSHARLARLLSQEPKSDTAIRVFQQAKAAAEKHAGQGELRAMRAWAHDLAALPSLRTTVISLGLSRPATAASYSALVADGNNVISQAVLPLLDTPGVVQANDLVTLSESLQSVTEESDLFSADLIARSYPPADQRLVNQLIVQRRELSRQGLPGLDRSYEKFFKNDISPTTSATLTNLENQIAIGPHHALRISPQAWVATNTAYNVSFRKALDSGSLALQDVAVAKARGLLLRLLLVGGLGLMAIVAAIVIAVIVSRTLLQQLTDLRRSALSLSSQQLPAIMARLRAGEEIDVGAETPQLEAGPNEIGQLQRAINVAAQTAIGAAVDEVALRRGVNDVFRNLARRNQSLLTRQLELLDAMERRVHDPEELADLFRVDHLTTRMRRHAEGLLIVAGGTSGRVWRDPVPIVDVMRAAVAEIEDYTRIRVTSRSSASVAGHAVADIIHLLAELVENATTFSPANTPVRIESDRVAKGLIVEIEDRGLGMGEDQIAEINGKLSDPPMLDLSGSEQLGLFIAGQLARRHDIKITMRGSAYGGITAVVLIPGILVIEAGYGEPAAVIGIRELGGRPVPQLPASAEPEELSAASMISPAAASYSSGTGYLVDLETAATQVSPAAHSGAADEVEQGELVDETAGPLGYNLPTYSSAEFRIAGLDHADAGHDAASGWPSLPGTPAASGTSTASGLRTPGLPASSLPAPGLSASGMPAPGMPAPGLSAPGLSAPGLSVPRNGADADPPMLVLEPVSDPSGPAAEFGLVDGQFRQTGTDFGSGTDFGPVTDHGPASDLGHTDGSGATEAADHAVGWPSWSSHAPGNERSGTDRVGWPDPTPTMPGWLNLPGSAQTDNGSTQTDNGSTQTDNDGPSDRRPEAPRPFAGSPAPGSGSDPGPLTASGSAGIASEFDLDDGPLLPKRQPRTPSLSLGPDGPSTDSFGPPLTNGEREFQPDSEPSGPPELDGLPMRVRQANIAPQLRESDSIRAEQFVAAPEMPVSSAPAADPSPFAAGRAAQPVPQHPSSGDPSPEAAMNLMSALQRGWERGRSQAENLTEESGSEQS